MDLDDVEGVDFRALGGADNIVVGDLSGTDMTQAGLDLRGPDGGGDGAADSITVNGSQGNDVFGAAGDAGGIDVQLLGVGRTGHVGFNEPGSSRDSRTRMITLDRVTRLDGPARIVVDVEHG